jgi:hypothetical protein
MEDTSYKLETPCSNEKEHEHIEHFTWSGSMEIEMDSFYWEGDVEVLNGGINTLYKHLTDRHDASRRK